MALFVWDLISQSGEKGIKGNPMILIEEKTAETLMQCDLDNNES